MKAYALSVSASATIERVNNMMRRGIRYTSLLDNATVLYGLCTFKRDASLLVSDISDPVHAVNISNGMPVTTTSRGKHSLGIRTKAHKTQRIRCISV